MLPAGDEVGRSLEGVLNLIQRQDRGLAKFEVSLGGFWRSFASFFLALPALIALLAALRFGLGLSLEGDDLLSDIGLDRRLLMSAALAWVVPPAIGLALALVLGLERRLLTFVVAMNWSGVFAVSLLAVPALLYVLGFATPDLAGFYAACFALIILNMRWFIVKTALGVSSGLALFAIACDIAIESGALYAIA
ncbi:MAG: hypothetical protein NVSMB26_15110 [Beijerinckiaceae bacterium]